MKNIERAITTAKIVTVQNGKRVIRKYTSGEPLVGVIEQDDAPPFTGYVRGWCQNKKGKKQ